MVTEGLQIASRTSEPPAPGTSALVEFAGVAESETRTRLRLVESGIELCALPKEDEEHYAEEHNGGWAQFLGRLA